MKIAVLGAGAMGSMLGAFLKAGGADVTLIVRRKELVDRYYEAFCRSKKGNDKEAEQEQASAGS